MSTLIGCCPKFRTASAYKAKCGYPGFEDATSKFLHKEYNSQIGSGCSGPKTATWDLDRLSCEETSSIPPGIDFAVCGEGYSDCEVTVTTTNTSRTRSSCGDCCSAGTDTDSEILSSEYTKAMLESDVDDLLDAVDWGSIADGEGAEMSYDSTGTPQQDPGTMPGVAAYYTDDPDEPTWIQKIALKYTPATAKICKLFWPQDGGACTREIVDVTIGTEITIDPPDDPGYIEVRPCCPTDVCS